MQTRRTFLKLFAKGTAFAFVAANVPLSAIKPTKFSDLNIGMAEATDIITGLNHVRFYWISKDCVQYGIDLAPFEPQKEWWKDPAYVECHVRPALEQLLGYIELHEGPIYKGVKHSLSSNIKGVHDIGVLEMEI